jgi:hypothetical protein
MLASTVADFEGDKAAQRAKSAAKLRHTEHSLAAERRLRDRVPLSGPQRSTLITLAAEHSR